VGVGKRIGKGEGMSRDGEGGMWGSGAVGLMVRRSKTGGERKGKRGGELDGDREGEENRKGMGIGRARGVGVLKEIEE